MSGAMTLAARVEAAARMATRIVVVRRRRLRERTRRGRGRSYHCTLRDPSPCVTTHCATTHTAALFVGENIVLFVGENIVLH